MGVQSRVTRQIENFAHPNPQVAIRAEGRLRDYGRRAKPLLIQACKDPRPEVRCRAAWLLGKLGGAAAYEAILPLCWDADYWVSHDARIALGQTGDPRAFEVLISILREDWLDVSAGYGLDALSGIEDRLLDLLEDECFKVRWTAATTLNMRHDSRVLPWLYERLNSDHPHERALAQEGLEIYDGTSSSTRPRDLET